MRSLPGAGAGRAGVLALVAVLACAPAAARPLTVSDVLQAEALGQAAASDDGRWLLLERRGAYASGARFDHDRYNDLFRTRLERVDLRAPGPPRTLVAPEPGVGYALGPIAPGGARAAVFRLRAERWELGIVRLADRQVTWTGLTPDVVDGGRSVQWRSPRELIVLALAPGLSPFAFRIHRPQSALPARWSRTARGGAAVTVVGAGAEATRPHDPPSRLMRVDAIAGTQAPLAVGDFRDLEVSASGQWAAVLSAAADIPMAEDRAIQGDFGLARQRHRLDLVDLRTGAVRRVCPGCDLLGRLLSWSPEADDLLVFARDDGAPWTAGRLLRVEAGTGEARPVGSDAVIPWVSGRPETVRAGWMAGAPLVLGRPRTGEGRLDWWRIGAGGATAVTRALDRVPLEGLTVQGVRLVAPDEAGGLAILSSDGRILETAAAAPGRPEPPAQGPPPRFGVALLEGTSRLALAGDQARLYSGTGPTRSWAVPPGAELVGAGPVGGGALMRIRRGGAETLLLVGPDGATPILELNAPLADLEAPEARPVRHLGPAGQPLTSWLVLPTRRGAGPPPLVVWPYLNLTYRGRPDLTGSLETPGLAGPALLAGHGYAVLLPSLPVSPQAASPASGAAAAVLAIVEAAVRAPDLRGAFDPGRLGLWGQSFGGYSVVAIVGQTDRFAAGVTAAAMPNLFAKWGDFGPLRRVHPERGLPDPGWTEDLQGDTRGPPWAQPHRFLDGSPTLNLGRATTPLLLFHGEFDNFSLSQSEQVFSAYLRRNRDAVLVTYWGEGHILRSPGNLADFYARGFDWLDRRLGFTSPADAARPARPEPAPATRGPTPPGPPRS